MRIRSTLVRAVMLLVLLSSGACGTARKATGSVKDSRVTLTDEEQRRYDYFYLEAMNQEEQGNYDVAFDLLQHCLDICPTAASALSALSNYYAYLNDREQALKMMQLAASYDPDNYWYQNDLAQAYTAHQDYDEAIAIYETMVSRFPSRSAELLPALGSLYQATEQYDKVIGVLDAMEERFGASEELEMDRFRIYWQQKDQEAAFRSMENMAAAHPDDVRYRMMLGDVCMNYGKLDEARQAYMAVLAVEPDNDMARLGLAGYYEKTGNLPEATAMVDSLVVYGHLSDDTRSQLIGQLIAGYEQRADTLAITDLWNRILAQPQTTADVASTCAAYYINAHKPDSLIIPVLNTILTIEPDNMSALKQLLYYAVENNDTEAVRQRSHALLAHYPDELYAYYYLVVTALRDKDDARAIDYCREGIGHISADSDTDLCTDLYTLLGDLYFSAHEDELGYAAYDSALVYNPSAVSVLNNYAYNLSLAGRDLDRAEEMSHTTVTREPDNSTYLDTYAWILFCKGRYDEARLYIDQALKNDTTRSSVLAEHAGDIYYRAGLPAEALTWWKQALDYKQAEKVEGEPVDRADRLAEDKLKKKIRLKKWIP